VAQAEFNRLVAKCKAEGRILTKGKIASLYGNAARYATQIHTHRWHIQIIQNTGKKMMLKRLRQQQELERFKAQPVAERSKVLI